MTAALSGADAKEDMVERVARALYEVGASNRGSVVDWEFFEWSPNSWRLYSQSARAAIAAMREPTAVMCAAAEATGDHWYFDDSWAAMIDAALQEGK